MTVAPNVFEHVGIGLYSNIAIVLTEAAANAWDVDASSVQNCVDPNNELSEPEGDGINMPVDDLNGKYLRDICFTSTTARRSTSSKRS